MSTLIDIELLGYRCERCQHEWVPRGKNTPTVCPGCKSPYWDKQRANHWHIET